MLLEVYRILFWVELDGHSTSICTICIYVKTLPSSGKLLQRMIRRSSPMTDEEGRGVIAHDRNAKSVGRTRAVPKLLRESLHEGLRAQKIIQLKTPRSERLPYLFLRACRVPASGRNGPSTFRALQSIGRSCRSPRKSRQPQMLSSTFWCLRKRFRN